MRQCAPSDCSEEGVDMSLVKHSLGDGPTRSSSHLRCLRPLPDPFIHSRCSHVDLPPEQTMHQPLVAARLRNPESSSDTSYHIICATFISLLLYPLIGHSGGDCAAHAAQYASPSRPTHIGGSGGDCAAHAAQYASPSRPSIHNLAVSRCGGDSAG